MNRRNFFLIKPDAVQRGIQWQILQQMQDAGFRILVLAMRPLEPKGAAAVSDSQAQSKLVHERLVKWYSENPCIFGIAALDSSGSDAIEGLIKIKSLIRARFSVDTVAAALAGERAVHNCFHCSDTPESYKFERFSCL